MGTRRIPLTQGQFALVGEADFAWLNQFKWSATWDPGTKSFSATRHGRADNGKSTTLVMAREILGAPRGVQVDHRSHDTLDNRRENLRLATMTQNQQNAHRRRDNTSGFKGVGFDKSTGKWRARIRVNGQRVWLGCHSAPGAAYAAYLKAAAKWHGEFACIG